METLTKENYLLFAADNYSNINCTSIADFHKDVKIVITARTLFRNYHKGQTIKIRLMLNHIITCTNVFGNSATVRMFFFQCEEELHSYLYTVFDFLKILPHTLEEADIMNLKKDEKLDQYLREL